MNRMNKAALAGALAAMSMAPAFAAPTIRVDFDLQYVFPGYTAFDGWFVASDANADGEISQGEVSFFANNGLGPATLLAFGDFDIANNLWTTDNSSQAGEYYVATAGSSTYYDGIRPDTRITVVPEPANALLMGLGFAALAVSMVKRRLARRTGR